MYHLILQLLTKLLSNPNPAAASLLSAAKFGLPGSLCLPPWQARTSAARGRLGSSRSLSE